MLQPILEPAWVDAFENVLERCGLKAGYAVSVGAQVRDAPVVA